MGTSVYDGVRCTGSEHGGTKEREAHELGRTTYRRTCSDVEETGMSGLLLEQICIVQATVHIQVQFNYHSTQEPESRTQNLLSNYAQLTEQFTSGTDACIRLSQWSQKPVLREYSCRRGSRQFNWTRRQSPKRGVILKTSKQ